MDGLARVWKLSCTVSLHDDCGSRPHRAVGGGVVAFIVPWRASIKPANWMIPATGVDPVNLRVMSPARCRCATPVKVVVLCFASLSRVTVRFCKADELDDTGGWV